MVVVVVGEEGTLGLERWQMLGGVNKVVDGGGLVGVVRRMAGIVGV